MMTLFVLPGSRTGKSNFRRAVDSFGNCVRKAWVLSDTPFSELTSETKWIGFIYSDEVMSEGVKDVLDTYMEADQWDYYTFYRRAVDGKVSASPRIFKSHIKLREDAPYPKNIEELTGTFVLDGMVLEQE